jgi:hypothetical protein
MVFFKEVLQDSEWGNNMALLNSYAIWNNKGGVGKSTITFHIASRYAEKHPDHNVLVIDLCPQANASMMLLGGGVAGEDRVLGYLENQPLPRTVLGYVSCVLDNGPGAVLPDARSFLVTPNEVNPQMPTNLVLLSGDGNLEPAAPLISERARFGGLTGGIPPWKWVHLIVRDLINNVTRNSRLYQK